MKKIIYIVAGLITVHMSSGFIAAAEIILQQYPFDNTETAIFYTKDSSVPESPFPNASADRFPRALIKVEKEAYQLLREYALSRTIAAMKYANAVLRNNYSESDQIKGCQGTKLVNQAVNHYTRVMDTPRTNPNNVSEEETISECALMCVLQWANKIEIIFISKDNGPAISQTRVYLNNTYFNAKSLLLAFIQRMRDIETRSKSLCNSASE